MPTSAYVMNHSLWQGDLLTADWLMALSTVFSVSTKGGIRTQTDNKAT
jgi:hypothetical protein